MSVECYKVPAGTGESEYIEKKSRFLSYIHPVETPENAAAILADYKKRFWDASHVCYAYILRSGEMRFSDDGEPKGTAGMPALEVLRREEVFNVLCVIVRYFGGTLLGAGGLTRAYSKAAKDALDNAGQAMMSPMIKLRAGFEYRFLDIVRRRCESAGARETGCVFGAAIDMSVMIDESACGDFCEQIREATAGAVSFERVCRDFFPKKI